MALNGITNPDHIQAGQILELPAATGRRHRDHRCRRRRRRSHGAVTACPVLGRGLAP